MKANSLAFRLFATAMAWTLIALPIVGIIIYSLISNLIMDGFESRLRQHMWVLQSEAIDGGLVPARPRELAEPLFGVTNSGWYWQIRPAEGNNGRTYVSNSLATGELPSPHASDTSRVEGDMRWLDVKGPLDQPLRIVELAGRISENEAAPTYLFAVAGPLDWPGATINNFATILAIALGLTGLALLAATFLQVKVALRPLAQIEKGLSDIRSGAAERLAGGFPAEIAPLQIEVNALLESNEDIIERARTQVGNLAHALKTPLAVLVNEAGQNRSPLAERVAEQSAVMSGQISYYLDRAQIAARANTIGRVTPVLPILEGLKRALERIHLEKAVRITLDVPSDMTFRGEKQDLEELLGNLLDNASKWAAKDVTVAGGPEVGTERHGVWLKLTIEDDGPGVPESQRDVMMRRGQRLDETKPGSGLGLSIVSDLVTSYQGRIEFSKSAKGGLKVELVLPAAGRAFQRPAS